ncbi:ATP-binding cassette domain-containing protein [Stenotrophomonas sp. YIM B06876]|uniref:ATP-binding cassette domain-containing protein n=1 Tax=Stenotrophomonas sp. YIM B06876 TaxID=3060211 RepID=UPI00273A2EB7|nr:ATP-binding cassette domain-containing protein [Stenotrophomonas sp. YIM B06876]
MLFDFHIRKVLRAADGEFRLDVSLHTDCRRVVVLGDSGAGKSLTLKAVAGLLRPDSGFIRVAGTSLFDRAAGVDLAPQARALGYVFQDYALFPHLTVRQNIGFPLHKGLFNPRRGRRCEAVDYWLDALQIGHLAEHYPGQISGGQRQRTAVARALVARPRALLLDEPFAALDQGLRRSLRLELLRLLDVAGIPLLLITHDREDEAAFGGQVLHLSQGRSVDSGAPFAAP